MTVSHVEILVEEPLHGGRAEDPGAEDASWRHVRAVSALVQGRLLKRLPHRLRGYSKFLPGDWRVVVLVDRDDDDCVALKDALEGVARGARLKTRSRSSRSFRVVNRIAIEELEAWYFGDWEAVTAAYPRVNRTVPHQARYRNPDDIRGGTWEALERILQAAGYFRSGLRKIEAARAIASHMDPARNRSPSFRALREVLETMSSP